MAAIEEWGSMSQEFVDQMVGDQRANPRNFKDITDGLVLGSRATPHGDPVFYLSMMLATAIIELAGRAES